MTSWTPLLNDIPPPGNSFVLPEHKMVYMSVTKVACTSLRWMVADLAGEDLASFYTGIGAHQSRLMTIHRNRTHWEKTPQLFALSAEERAQISRDNGWFIFAVVRDPWSRIWSGWQSKFLVRHQLYYDNFSDRDWFPRVPMRQEEVIEDFAKFIEAAPWTTDPLLSLDVHFLPQVFSVRPRGVNYTNVYDLQDMPALFADVHAHLATVGKDKELYVPRANETPLPLISAVLDNGVAEAIEDLYRGDFDEYGERWDVGSIKMDQDGWSQDALRHAAYHTVANQRIGDMRNEARRFRRELAKSNVKVQRLKRELAAGRRGAAARKAKPPAPPRPLWRRVAGRARRELRAMLSGRNRTA
jgi:Sulfotransferase family